MRIMCNALLENSELFKNVQKLLKKQYQYAHSLWVHQLVGDLGDYLRTAIRQDTWNHPGRSKSWEGHFCVQENS
jgi:hypothetical protein